MAWSTPQPLRSDPGEEERGMEEDITHRTGQLARSGHVGAATEGNTA